jgi:hypothetical protein
MRTEHMSEYLFRIAEVLLKRRPDELQLTIGNPLQSLILWFPCHENGIESKVRKESSAR